jgi:hypothetical protein
MECGFDGPAISPLAYPVKSSETAVNQEYVREEMELSHER